MRINNQDIIRTAREMRDEENNRLHVRSWGRRARFRIPAWLVAVPAAAIVGFFFGVLTGSQQSTDAPLTAMADTVYVKVKERIPVVDTVYMDSPSLSAPTPTNSHVAKAKAPVKRNRAYSTGQSMQNDRIRYDLLVRN